MPISAANSFGTRDKLNVGAQEFEIQRLEKLEEQGLSHIEKLPFSLRILLENLLRFEDGRFVHANDIKSLAKWTPSGPEKEIAFMPARILLQDFTGVPAIVDLATMREAMHKMGGNPKRINPLFPAELVIDHSVQVDSFGGANSFGLNAELEFQRNVERYAFLRWGQTAFRHRPGRSPSLRHIPAPCWQWWRGRARSSWSSPSRRIPRTFRQRPSYAGFPLPSAPSRSPSRPLSTGRAA